MSIAGVALFLFGVASVYDGRFHYPEVNRDYQYHLGVWLRACQNLLEADSAKGDSQSREELSTEAIAVEYSRLLQSETPAAVSPLPELIRSPEMGVACQKFQSLWLERVSEVKKERFFYFSRGWKDDKPKNIALEASAEPVAWKLEVAPYKKEDIRTQFLYAAFCLPIGFLLLFRLVRTLPKTVQADGDTLYAVDGATIPFASITDIDKRRWDRKAIAVVHYETGGTKGKTVIDDWIYQGAAAVLERRNIDIQE